MLSEQITDYLDGLSESLSADEIVPASEPVASRRLQRFALPAAAAIAVLVAAVAVSVRGEDMSTDLVTTDATPAPIEAPFDLTDAFVLDFDGYQPSSAMFAAAGSFGVTGMPTGDANVWVLDTPAGKPVMVIDELDPGTSDALWLFIQAGSGEPIDNGVLVGVDAYRYGLSADLPPEERAIAEDADRQAGQRDREVIAWIDDAGDVQAVTGFVESGEDLLAAAEQWAQSRSIERVGERLNATNVSAPSNAVWPATVEITYNRPTETSEHGPVQVVTFDASLQHTMLAFGLQGSPRSFDGRTGYLVGDPPYLAIFEAAERTVIVSEIASFTNAANQSELDDLVNAVRPATTDDLASLPTPQSAPDFSTDDANSAAMICDNIERVADQPGSPAWVAALSYAAELLPAARPGLRELIDATEPGATLPTIDELEMALGVPCRQVLSSASFEIATDPAAEPPVRLAAEYGGTEDFCLTLSVGTEFDRMARQQCIKDWNEPTGGLVIATTDDVTTIAGWLRDPATEARLTQPSESQPSLVITAGVAGHLRDLSYTPGARPHGYFVIQVPAIGPGQRVEIELTDQAGNVTATLRTTG